MGDIIQRSIRAHRISQAEAVSAAAYESTGVDFVTAATNAIALFESRGERNRREVIANRRAIYEERWQELLHDHLTGYWTPASLGAILGAGNQVDVSENPLLDISSELAVLYLQRPLRRIGDDDGTLAHVYEKMVGGPAFHQFWQAVNQALEVFRDLIIWPQAYEDKRTGETRIRNHFAAGDSYSVITEPDDPTQVHTLVVLLPQMTQDERRYAFWTPDWHGVFSAHVTGTGAVSGIKQIGPDGFVNPLGFIPYVHVHADFNPRGYWNTTRGQSLVDATLSAGEQLLQLRYSRKMSSFKQGVVTGQDVDKIPQQLRDEGALIKIVGDSLNFSVVDWQPDFKAKLTMLNDTKMRVAASRGINPERLKRTANYQTAAGALAGDRGLMERRERQVSIYRIAEEEYYGVTVAVARAAGVKGASSLDPSAELTVDHAMLAYPGDPVKQAQLDKGDIQMGVKSISQVAQERNPDLTDDEAEKLVDDNVAEIASVAQTKMAHIAGATLTGGTSTTTMATDEENGTSTDG